MRDFNKLKENSKIYIIKSANTDKIYIGCTSERTLQTRLNKHVYDFKKYNDNNTKRYYCSSYQVLSHGDYSIECLEDCSNISDRNQLFKRELHYIQTLPCVNKLGKKNISL